MGIRFTRAIAIFGLAAGLPACTMIDQTYFDKNRMSVAGPQGVIARDLEQVDLFAQIARGDFCVQYRILSGLDNETDSLKCKAAVESFVSKGGDDGLGSARLARAYAAFDDMPGDKLARRSQIQDEIFRASEQRCNAYKTYLQRVQSNTSFFYGALSTVLGGLGAVFTDASVARTLSASAGISSGVGAQFNESYFFSQAVPLISDGIDMARSTVHDQAMQNRGKPLAEYTLQAAILDAVRYDGACGIPEGLKKAGEAIKTVKEVGPGRLKQAVDTINDVRSVLPRRPSGN